MADKLINYLSKCIADKEMPLGEAIGVLAWLRHFNSETEAEHGLMVRMEKMGDALNEYRWRRVMNKWRGG